MWPGSGLGVVLHAEQRHRPMLQAFKGVVVQVDVRQLDFALFERVRIDGEVMVVGRDFDFASGQRL